jgi:hypothetical protein
MKRKIWVSLRIEEEVVVKTGLEWSDRSKKGNSRSWERALYTWLALSLTFTEGRKLFDS